MKRVLQGAFWIGVYLLLVCTPLFMLLIGQTPVGRSFWREFSVAIGFAGLAIMGFQFLITARDFHAGAAVADRNLAVAPADGSYREIAMACLVGPLLALALIIVIGTLIGTF